MTVQTVTQAGPSPSIGVSGVVSLLPYRRLVVRSVVAAAVLTALVSLVYPTSWTSRGSFVAQGGRAESLGSLAGLASQFGVNLAGGGGGFQPRFFASLVTSDQVLGAVAGELVAAKDGADKPTVEDLLKIKGITPGVRRERAILYLRRNVVSALYDQRDGLTTFSATTRSPDLSAAIAKALVREINRFTAEQLQAHASTERKFVENRRNVIGKELAGAEEALSRFLMRNREYQMSPGRKLETERLNRRVVELETVFSSLSQSFEQARIEEVRDTPVLTLVDVPAAPELPNRRAVVQWVLGLAFLAGVLVLGTILVLQRLGALAAHRDAPEHLADWWPILKRDLTRPWRLLF